MDEQARASSTINFVDRGDRQNGIIIIRSVGDRVALCLSLEEDGDVEALLDQEVIRQLIVALQAAVE